MTKQINISPKEKRILQNINLKGTMGKCGRMTKEERLQILFDLINKGFLTDKMKVTPLGLEVSAPFFTDSFIFVPIYS